jgi:negative regulator of flagellin synthesis FlgM
MSSENAIGSVQQAANLTGSFEVNSTTKAGSPRTAIRRESESAASLSQNDRTNLSSASGLVGQALAASDARLDKVAALQSVIAAGSYNVQSSDVADKIIYSLLG